MTKEQLEKREQALSEAGYNKNRNTSSINYHSWFKTICDPKSHDVWFYMIEWRVWEWVKYIDRDPCIAKRPYSMELCIIANLPDSSSSRMVYPDRLSIEQAEVLAEKFYKLITE